MNVFVIRLGAIMAAIFLFLTGCAEEEKKAASVVVRPVRTMVLTSSASGGDTRTFPGKVQASQQVDLAFRISGPLVDFPVNEGQAVAKGDLIARIDPRDYKTDLAHVESSLAEARANLKSMKAGARPEDVKVLEAEVAAAKARFQEAEQNFKRYENLYSQEVVPKADYDRYKSARDVAKAHLNTASQNLRKGKKGARREDIDAMTSRIRGLEAQRKKAQAALDDTYLRSPFSGVIAKKFVEKFQDVDAKKPIVSLQDVSSIEILVDIPEKDMATVDETNIAKITAKFEFLPDKEFAVEIKEHGTQADPQTKTYPVTLTMAAPEGVSLLPGMTATITGRMKHSGNANGSLFTIPVSAVFADEPGRQYTWVVDQTNMTVSKREISVGRLTGKDIQVSQGLKAGEMIATAGVHFLQENMEVRVLENEKGGIK
ncbi:efflux RND transporter periplasmic adaptor subunit [Desulfonema magnum]|uniref:Efflux transporter, RND family n=1 Tax=Desulfonema magnum TaxID=45655 RepID=A0A975BWN8_9BACT|nr:efflux RND transporter periplasmic adaptor subunit [Desulfonema magnum]QTA93151.1 Efflux transporter, RND family [Desulfonema magnum]